MNDLARSDSYYKKQCLKEFGFIPPQSEIKKRLGPNLTHAFFQSCLPSLKPYLGLCPTLDGPGEDLWVSPSDLLIGKVRLKPPFTSKHVAALTHQGILEIGYEVEQKFMREHELDKEKAIRENKEMWRFISEKDKKEAIEKAREEEQFQHEKIIAKLKEDFEEDLKAELQKLEDKLVEEKYTAVQEGKEETMRIMQEKLEAAVVETVLRLTEQFAVTLMEQNYCLHEHFWYHLRKQKQKYKQLITDEKSKCRDILENLRVEMQCENIANVMYVLAKERRQCYCEKQLLEQNFLTKLQELEKELESNNEKLKITTSELKRLGHEVQARDLALYEIIKQFQKFIYFVLRAVPTQAEYLLNVEKLMIFELTTLVKESKPGYFLPGVCTCQENLLKSTPIDSEKETISFSESSSERTNDLVIQDYHMCNKHMKYIPSAETLGENEDLPAFTYNENLYVREDFRNMISQGLKISESNELWNFGTNDLVELMEPRRSSDICKVDIDNQICDPHKQVNVRFSKKKINEVYVEEEVIQNYSYASDTTIEREAAREAQNSKLSLARDSILVIKSQKERLSLSLTPYHNTRDSIILNAQKSTESKISSTKDIISRKRDSKIELAVDSLTLLRSSDRVRSKISLKKEEGFIKQNHYVSIGVQANMPRKKFRVSHIEIIPSDEKRSGQPVMFATQDKVIPDAENKYFRTSGDKLPLKWRSPEEIYGRPSEIEVVGDKSLDVHLEKQDEFTAKRVTSFIRIFRQHPSLRRLFTEVKNK